MRRCLPKQSRSQQGLYGDAAYRGQASIEPGREISELSATANLDKKHYGVTRSQANLCGFCTMRFLHFLGQWNGTSGNYFNRSS